MRNLANAAAIISRFWDKVQKSPECWNWTAYCFPSGYGYMNVDGRTAYAHRLSWEIHHGRSVPDGMEIDHLCRNRSCVNPAHLEAVTHHENMRRGNSPWARAHRTGKCKRGHLRTPENLRKVKGRRELRCVLCDRETALRSYYRNKEKKS